MANTRNGTRYTRVTTNIVKRAYEHREGLIDGFTKKYGCKLLVFYEPHRTLKSAIAREKQIKARTRKKKLSLIEGMNPAWRGSVQGSV